MVPVQIPYAITLLSYLPDKVQVASWSCLENSHDLVLSF